LKLETKIRRSAQQVKQDGQYTIKSVTGPQTTRYGAALVLSVNDDSDQEKTLFLPYSNEVSDQSNLARLMQSFGKETNLWIKRKVDVTIGPDGRRTIKPVIK